MTQRQLRPLVVALQAALVVIVVGWVLNAPGRVGVALYTEQMLAAVLGLTIALVFLTIAPEGGELNLLRRDPDRRVAWYDLLAAAAGLATCLYVAWRYPDLVLEMVLRPVDGIIVSTVIVLLVTEATRRTSGWALILINVALCAYALLGYLMPAEVATRPVSLSRLMVYLGIDTNAIFGGALQIAVIVVVPFVIMGQVLNRSGGSEYFTDLAMAMMGRFRGGAAKIAVVGSAFFGMISGSAVSNVAAVGTITIPLMKRAGFPGTIAGAIEAVGSTGGQLMPPVMGAAAFLMAEYMQVPYKEVMVAAIIPALLYYAALFIQVDLEAAKRRILGAPVPELPKLGRVLIDGWYFPIPFAVLIGALLVWNEQAEYAALLATAVLLVLSFVFGYKGRRLTLAGGIAAVVSAGGAVLDIVIITAASGILIGVLNLTGLAFGLTLQLIAASGGSLAILLIVTAIVAMLLGLGLPTVGVYVILATLAAPALIQAGVTPMQAHLFVLFHGMLGMVTPPVALAAFAAANIAGADQWRTGWAATRVGWCAYLIPFLFAYSPALIMRGDVATIIVSTATAIFGILLGTAAIVGYLRGALGPGMRLVFLVVGLLLLLPVDAFAGAWAVNAAAIAAGAGLVWWEARRREPAAVGGR